MTPLHWAVQNEHIEVVSTLLKHGANPLLVNKFDKTPLDIAIELNRMDILQTLQVIQRDSIVNELSAELNVEDEKVNDSITSIENGMLKSRKKFPNFQTDLHKTYSNLEKSYNKNNYFKFFIDETPHIEPPIIVQDAPKVNIPTNSVKYTFTSNKVTGNIFSFLYYYQNLIVVILDNSLPPRTFDMADSIEMLKEHGISFLQNNDENSVVASAVENGHSLVLTGIKLHLLMY